MKKVLFLNLTAFSQTGGIERFNRCFLKALSDFGKEQRLVSTSYSAYDNSASAQYYEQGSYRGFSKNKLMFAIKSTIAARNNDIIIVGHVNLAPIALLIKSLFPAKKMILITHGIDVWGELNNAKSKLLRVVDGILSVSSYTKDKLVTRHAVPEQKVTVFPNTIDPYFPVPERPGKDISMRERYGINKNDFVLFTLTRLKKTELYKGYDNVINAVAEIVKDHPDIKYVIGGKYDEQEYSRVNSLVAEMGLEKNIVLTGYLDEQELVPHYKMSDLYIMPSKKEGFGIVFIEALVSGVPVVAGNADGSVDALAHGELGTLVDPDSIEEIKSAIETHMAHSAERTEAERKNVQEKTLSYFSFDSYKKRLGDVLASV